MHNLILNRFLICFYFHEQLSGDINEEVDTHNRMLDRMVIPLPFVLLSFPFFLTDAIGTEHFVRFCM